MAVRTFLWPPGTRHRAPRISRAGGREGGVGERRGEGGRRRGEGGSREEK